MRKASFFLLRRRLQRFGALPAKHSMRTEAPPLSPAVSWVWRGRFGRKANTHKVLQCLKSVHQISRSILRRFRVCQCFLKITTYSYSLAPNRNRITSADRLSCRFSAFLPTHIPEAYGSNTVEAPEQRRPKDCEQESTSKKQEFVQLFAE